MKLLVAVEQRHARIVGNEIDLGFTPITSACGKRAMHGMPNRIAKHPERKGD